MKRLYTVLSLLVSLGLAITSAGNLAQAQDTGFQPTVGQAGKDVVWVPTQQDLVERMLDLAKVTPQDYVIDLGSGDGRTVIAAAKRGAKALGIEYNPDMVDLSKKNAAEAGVGEKAVFLQADLFESDFSQATVVTMFLLPQINLRLRPKILDMKPGTRAVSNSFTMEDWEPDDKASLETNCSSWCTAYLWIVPAKVDGKWKMPQGELTLKQEFQKISGTISLNGKNSSVSGKLTGDQISFTGGGVQYTGHVNGDSISGTANSSAGNASWSATHVK
jgi:hypothetical protein